MIIPLFLRKQIFKPDIVLCDEVQFYSKHHILELVKIVDQLKIPVIAYGLKILLKILYLRPVNTY